MKGFEDLDPPVATRIADGRPVKVAGDPRAVPVAQILLESPRHREQLLRESQLQPGLFQPASAVIAMFYRDMRYLTANPQRNARFGVDGKPVVSRHCVVCGVSA
jgi:hypothetical protein